MIKYSGNTINGWDFNESDITKVYRNNAVVYQKLTTGGTQPSSCIDDSFIIPFEDSNVKTLCVNNWGGNVVAGEITYGETKQVTSLGSVFKCQTGITSFNELVYFTGLSTLDNGEFAGCANLTDIVIPANVTTIDNANVATRCVFSGCSNLSGITFISGESPLYIGGNANNRSYYMKSAHQGVPMVFPNRNITFSNGAFSYYDYLAIVYFQTPTPPTNIENADINNYRKLSTVYCPVGAYNAYFAVLNPKGKTVIEYDYEVDSNNVLVKEKEWKKDFCI